MEQSLEEIEIVRWILSGTSWQIGRDRSGNIVLCLYKTGRDKSLKLHLSSRTEHIIWRYCYEQGNERKP